MDIKAKDFKTIESAAQDEFVEKRSRFIGYIAPCKTEEEAAAFINEIKTRHRDATHNVYAYSLRKDNLKRFSDDGEPQGTAGKPVLDVLLGSEIVDAAIVVTRYFGGTLLGTGGLVRAYTKGAQAAIDAAKVMVMRPACWLNVVVPYDFYGKITYIIPDYEIKVLNSDFGENVTLELLIPAVRCDEFLKKLTEMSAATVNPEIIKEDFADFSKD